MHPGHETCKEAAAPVLFQLPAHSTRVQRTNARPWGDAKLQASHPAAGPQHGVTSLCGTLRCAADGKGLQQGRRWCLQLDKALLCESLSLALWHKSVIMAARISPVVCYHCHVESRDGSGLRSVSAFPFDTVAVSLWCRLSPWDQPTQAYLAHWRRFQVSWSLLWLELPICTLYCLICSLGLSKPAQGCCPGLRSPHVRNCHCDLPLCTVPLPSCNLRGQQRL